MREVAAAVTARLQGVGKEGYSVEVLLFGGRALSPSDSLAHLMRCVMCVTSYEVCASLLLPLLLSLCVALLLCLLLSLSLPAPE